MLAWLVAACSVAALLALAAFVFCRGARTSARVPLAALLMVLAGFSGGLDVAILTSNERVASLGYHLVFFVCILALPLYLEFVLSFLGIAENYVTLRAALVLASVALAVPGFLNAYPVWLGDDGRWYPQYQLLPAFLPYVIVWLVTGAFCLTLLWREYRLATGVRWRQLGAVFYGSNIAWLGATSAYGLIRGHSWFPAWDLAFVLMALMLVYAMVMYRMLDVNFVIRQSIVYSVVSAFFAAGFWGTLMAMSVLAPRLAPVLSGVLAFPLCFAIALLFRPLERRVQSFIDARWFQMRQDFADRLAHYTNELSELRDEASVKQVTRRFAGDTLACGVAVTAKSNPSRKQDIVLTPRSSGEPFTREELDFIATMTSEMNIALENCRLVAELEREQEQVRKAERLAAMGAVVAGVVHDIRRPLAGMKLNAELLAEELPDTDERASYVHDILEATRNQEAMLENLLSSVQPTLRRTPTSLLSLLDGVRRDVRPLLSERVGVELSVLCENEQAQLDLDLVELRRAIANVVGNAIEAVGEQGSVTLRARVAPNAQFEISDNGPGIASDDLRRIFEPLFTTKEKGTGLGLAIAKRIVEAHGGSIGVESVPGHGATFTIQIPKNDESDAEHDGSS